MTNSANQSRQTPRDVVFLFDVDNTLLDNDRVQQDIREHLEQHHGVACRDRYWTILERIMQDVGYRDYLRALQQYREEHPTDIGLLAVSSFLMDYPFVERLYPGSLEVLERFSRIGTTVILSDGDVAFQPRKVERSGIAAAVQGRVLIYIHKELALDDVRGRFPATHYVLIDDKLRILSAVKAAWGRQVTTVWPRQGKFALDVRAQATYPPADVVIHRIADLLDLDPKTLGAGGAVSDHRRRMQV